MVQKGKKKKRTIEEEREIDEYLTERYKQSNEGFDTYEEYKEYMLDKYYYAEQLKVDELPVEETDKEAEINERIYKNKESIQKTTIDYYSGKNNTMTFILIGFIVAIILVFVTFIKVEQRRPVEPPTCYEIGRFAYNPDNYYNQKDLPICD